jgi:regulator of sigma E protease
MQVIISIVALIIVLGVLVFVHEFGHFIAARISGMRTDIFSLGMGKRLFGYHKKTGFTFGNLPEELEGEGHTDYRVSLFPIGGYVKIAGMIDESMDTESLKGEMKPWEFRAKPWYLKIFVLVAGVVMNFLLATFIYGLVSYSLGYTEAYFTEIGYVAENSIGDVIGFENDDKVISINNHKIETWNEIMQFLSTDGIADDFTVKVKRDGQDVLLHVNNKKYLAMLTSQASVGLTPKGAKVYAGQVQASAPADKAGLQVGDTLVSLDGQILASNEQLIHIVQSNKGKQLPFTYKRGSQIIETTVTPSKAGLIGIAPMLGGYDESLIKHFDYSFGESVKQGFVQSVETITLLKVSISKMINGSMKASESLGGPIMIADQAGQMFNRGFFAFISFMAMLSISLAVLNILPVPALDGGQIVVVIIEAIIRRELPERAKIIIQQVGLFIILGLMVLVFYNDIARLLR